MPKINKKKVVVIKGAGFLDNLVKRIGKNVKKETEKIVKPILKDPTKLTKPIKKTKTYKENPNVRRGVAYFDDAGRVVKRLTGGAAPYKRKMRVR